MQKKSNSNTQAMEESLKNRTFGKTVIDALDNLPQTKTAILISVNDLYSSPKKWNFYDPLDDNKKLELMESIQENGILSPIIVWNVDFDIVENEYAEDEDDVYLLAGNKYLILAGHNRVDAFNKLYKATGDSKYLKIPAFIFDDEELKLDNARDIVVDSNYVQRSLSTKEKVKSVMFKYAELEKNKTQKGRTKEIVAEVLNMSPSMVQNYKKLS
ncbi:MAG: ParB/RepB/Spo0J family partition protein, partial [Peptostreptococcaceae bacterium]